MGRGISNIAAENGSDDIVTFWFPILILRKAMNFEQMKMIEPELARLEHSAFLAGENQAAWTDTAAASRGGYPHVRAREAPPRVSSTNR